MIQQLPYGNDGVFSVFLYYTSSEVVGYNGEPLSSVPRTAVDVKTVQNLTVKAVHALTLEEVAVPFRTDSAVLNLIIIELPKELQKKGRYNYVVEFDVASDDVTDKLLHRRVEGELCEVTALGVVMQKTIITAEVLPLVRGVKGDKGDTPTFTLKKDETNGKTYLAVGDDYLRDEEGTRVFIQRETTNLIDYAPTIELRPFVDNSWDGIQVFGFDIQNAERFRGVFPLFTDLYAFANASQFGTDLTPPFPLTIRNNAVTSGLYVRFSIPQNQPTYQAVRDEHRTFALVVRVEALLTAVKVSLTSAVDNTGVIIEQGNTSDLAIPMPLNSSYIHLRITSKWDEPTPGVRPFVLHDVRFIDITPKG